MLEFTNFDLAAVGGFIVLWAGYTYYAEHSAAARGNLIDGMAIRRKEWMTAMLKRDNRMVDIQIVNALLRSGRFFASTAILIIAGLLAVLGATEQAIALVMDLPFTVSTSREIWEAKILFMILVFIYAFFKFVWSMRQYNYCSILIGAAPAASDLPDDFEAVGASIATLASLAAKHSNRGIRAYYFGLAALGWFVHPWLLLAAAIWVVLVLYRREFRSKTMQLTRPSEGL
ncbi:MAG: DUF599 family protein [Alphaproteobacteria bacterium]|nr:DUF599 family protein [Alphaproteobacteria bacterium]